MSKAARENRICVCGCGQMFETKKTSCKKYVNREHYYRHKDRGLRVPEETRECACGCGETFVSKINSGRRYICGHNGRGRVPSQKQRLMTSLANSGDRNPAKRSEVRKKISKALTGRKDSDEVKRKKSLGRLNSEKFRQAMKTRKPPRLGTKTSAQALENMRKANQSKNYVPSEETKEKIRNSLLGYFSVLENRVKRAKEIAQRVQSEGYRYKNGYVHLPILGVSLFYRSSYEQQGLLLLDTKREVKQILVETVHIPYETEEGITKIYMPDWLVETVDGDVYLIEVKPSCFTNTKANLLKAEAGIEWCIKNNAVYCIWTEDVLFNPSSTTTSLQAIVEATAVYSQSRRDSLNCMETCRKEQK